MSMTLWPSSKRDLNIVKIAELILTERQLFPVYEAFGPSGVLAFMVMVDRNSVPAELRPVSAHVSYAGDKLTHCEATW